MSRNSEKAQSALNRYLRLKNKEAGVLESNPNFRPKYVQSEKSLPQAEKWRATVLSLISINLGRIQDITLNEHQIRDINQELNTLFKEKRAWEHHIKQLGGPDHINYGQNMGQGAIEMYGTRYYGLARELPDVVQMMKEHKTKNSAKAKAKSDIAQERKTIEELTNRISPSYYGIQGDDTTEEELRRQLETGIEGDVFESLPSTEEVMQEMIKKRKAEVLAMLE